MSCMCGPVEQGLGPGALTDKSCTSTGGAGLATGGNTGVNRRGN